MKKIIVFILLFFILSVPVCADDNYSKQYDNIGADHLQDGLDNETRDFLNENGINAKDSNWTDKLSEKGVIEHIWQFITDGAKTPIKAGVLIASIMFLAAALTSFDISSRFETAIYAVVLCICAVIATDVWQCVSSAINAVKGCSSFMLSFIPIFASVTALSGKAGTATGMSTLLLFACEVISFLASFVVLPLMGGYLALSVSSAVSPLVNGQGIVDSVKKLSMWIMSLLGTLFIGVLGIQTAVNSAKDSVTLRTAKFILGTSVPVAGGVLSEAVSTVSASMGLLRSSVGIYGIVALAFILLPIVIELVLWRCMLMINIALGEIFSLGKTTGILRAVDTMLSVILGIVLLVGALFIISLSVVVMAGKG